MVAYKVGSADEDLDHTGLSHYLEHLMFKGTDKLMPGDIDRLTLRNGGANNAYTSEDMTVFHFDFAADRWKAGLEVEADRMRNLRIDEKHEFEQEKGAVISELDRDEDEPWDLEQKAILPLLFGQQDARTATRSSARSSTSGRRPPRSSRGTTTAGITRTTPSSSSPAGSTRTDALDEDQEAVRPDPEGRPARRASRSRRPGRGPRRSARSSSRSSTCRGLLDGFNTVAADRPGRHPPWTWCRRSSPAARPAGCTSKLVEGDGALPASVDAEQPRPAGTPAGSAIKVEMLKGKDRGEGREDRRSTELKRLADEPADRGGVEAGPGRSMLAAHVFARESVHGLADAIARGVTTNDLRLRPALPAAILAR